METDNAIHRNQTCPESVPEPTSTTTPQPLPEPEAEGTVTFTITGQIPPELWNRLGTKFIPKLRSGNELQIEVDISVTVGVNNQII